jgi:hypothetical protein
MVRQRSVGDTDLTRRRPESARLSCCSAHHALDLGRAASTGCFSAFWGRRGVQPLPFGRSLVGTLFGLYSDRVRLEGLSGFRTARTHRRPSDVSGRNRPQCAGTCPSALAAGCSFGAFSFDDSAPQAASSWFGARRTAQHPHDDRWAQATASGSPERCSPGQGMVA